MNQEMSNYNLLDFYDQCITQYNMKMVMDYEYGNRGLKQLKFCFKTMEFESPSENSNVAQNMLELLKSSAPFQSVS